MRLRAAAPALALALALAAAALLAGGGGGGEARPDGAAAPAPAEATEEAALPAAPAPPPPARAPRAPEPRPDPAPERARVLEAYLAYWEVYADALARLDDAGLGEVMGGPLLDRTRGEIERLRGLGLAARIEVEHGVLAVEVDGEAGRATVVDAYRNRSVLVDAATGEPRGPAPQGTRVTDAYVLVWEEGRWRVHDGFRSQR